MAGTDLVVAHLDFDGNTIVEYENPAGLRWTYQIGAKGPGMITHLLAESDPGVTRDGFAPKRTDFALREGVIDLMVGHLWSVRYPLDEEQVEVSGRDYLQWLDQPPLLAFDYTEPDYVAQYETIKVFSTVTTDALTETNTLQDILDWLIEVLTTASPQQLILLPEYTGTAFSEVVAGYIERSPSISVLQVLQEIAQLGAPLGFDFWAAPDRTIQFVGPRRTDPSSISPIYSFTDEGDDIVDGEFVNDGPVAAEILFMEGSGGAKRVGYKYHSATADQFRRWGATVMLDGGDVQTFHIGGDTEMVLRAQASQNRLMFPQRQLALTIRPENGFGFENRVMEAVDVDWEKYPTSYHRVDSFWWITSQTYYIADEGDMAGEWLCDLGLEQINVPIS